MPAPDFHNYARRVQIAARRADATASLAQREAGNARVGRVYLHGLEVAVEYPKGSIRKGKGGDGKVWSRVMRNHYGRLNRVPAAADGEPVDVFIGDHPEAQLAFRFEFLTRDGEHDEDKYVLGVRNLAEAKKVIRDNYPDGFLETRIGEIRGMLMSDFKSHVRGDKTKSAVERCDECDGPVVDGKCLKCKGKSNEKAAGKCCPKCGDGCPTDGMSEKAFTGKTCPECGASPGKDDDPRVKEVADRWFRPDGSPRTRAMSQQMIVDTMRDYDLSLRDAASLFERALLYYKDEHVTGGRASYWKMIDGLEKRNLRPHPDGGSVEDARPAEKKAGDPAVTAHKLRSGWGGDCPQVFVNARDRKIHLESGDWHEESDVKRWIADAKQAFPGWEVSCESECRPGGWSKPGSGWKWIKAALALPPLPAAARCILTV